MTTITQNHVSLELQANLDLYNAASDVQTLITNTVDTLLSGVSNTQLGTDFKQQLRSLQNNINNRLNEMAMTGYTALQMHNFGQQMVVKLFGLKADFTNNTAITDEKISKFHASIGNIQDKIRNQTFEPENFTDELF